MIVWLHINMLDQTFEFWKKNNFIAKRRFSPMENTLLFVNGKYFVIC